MTALVGEEGGKNAPPQLASLFNSVSNSMIFLVEVMLAGRNVNWATEVMRPLLDSGTGQAFLAGVFFVIFIIISFIFLLNIFVGVFIVEIFSAAQRDHEAAGRKSLRSGEVSIENLKKLYATMDASKTNHLVDRDEFAHGLDEDPRMCYLLGIDNKQFD